MIARLPVRIGEDTRAAFFDEPLAQVLSDSGLAEMMNGQTWWAGGAPASASLEIGLEKISSDALDLICDTLDALGAPKTSQLETEDGDLLRSFGLMHLISLRLDQQVRQTTASDLDPPKLIKAANAALGVHGSCQGAFGNFEGLNFYFVGQDPVELENRLQAFSETYPETREGLVVREI